MEFHRKKIMKYEELIKDHEPTKFNANVFKSVKLVMTEEELKVEEDKVRDLATYLKDFALDGLIKNF
jgi:hypothetical protein